MGSFDVTCAVSGLPANGKVRYMLLVEGMRGAYGSLVIGHNDVWSPLTPPMACDYYDRGRVRSLAPRLMREAWLATLPEERAIALVALQVVRH